jgi:hypothetical protein
MPRQEVNPMLNRTIALGVTLALLSWGCTSTPAEPPPPTAEAELRTTVVHVEGMT